LFGVSGWHAENNHDEDAAGHYVDRSGVTPTFAPGPVIDAVQGLGVVFEAKIDTFRVPIESMNVGLVSGCHRLTSCLSARREHPARRAPTGASSATCRLAAI
jgi:hypothetical protein